MAQVQVTPNPASDRTLVLLGSMGATHRMWDPQIAELAGRFRIVAMNHRGHGGAPAPPGPYSIAELGQEVIAALDDLGVERAGFAGASLGGMIAMWVAAHSGERVERLALLCTSAHMPPASLWAERAAAVREAASLDPIADAVVGRWLTPTFALANPGVVADLRSMLVSVDAEGYAGCCEAIEHMDLRADLGSIACPTLVIAGTHDPAASPEGHGSVIAAGIPGARLEEVPAAHLANIEQPEAVTDLLVGWLEGGSDGR
ncbi:MAG TPA: 3-oxoadipate enol-lactonase [Solirubrobacteraceae bacterium]|nr:3-oxoadipate enol-lactonase [Solirubrobacteraceae bacterium]